MQPHLQNISYHFILADVNLTLKIESSFFDAKPLQVCFELAKDCVIKYHSAPTQEQMKELIFNSDKIDIVPDDILEILYSAENQVREYPKDWLYDTIITWAQWKNFLNSIRNTVAYVKLNQENVTTENVKEIMEHAKSSFNKSCILDFDGADDMGSDFWDAMSHKQIKLIRSSTGYDFIDKCLKGGTFPGCLICFVGAPKSGKSLWLQNLCAESVKKGEDNAYISLELPEEMIHSRIGANIFQIPALNYEQYTADEIAFGERISAFKKSCLIKPGKLIVKSFPTSTLSVLELESYLLAKEEELSTEGKPFHFKNIYVDYINIMRNYRNPNSENTYMKIKQLAEDLKAIGIKHNWAILTATQTTRSQYDTNDMTANQVSESTGLGATVDVMFGIIADAMMKAQGRYYLKCIFDRVAPEDNKRKLFNLDSNYLRLTENMETPIEDVLPTVDIHSQFGKPKTQQYTYGVQQQGGYAQDSAQTNIANNLINITGKNLF